MPVARFGGTTAAMTTRYTRQSFSNKRLAIMLSELGGCSARRGCRWFLLCAIALVGCDLILRSTRADRKPGPDQGIPASARKGRSRQPGDVLVILTLSGGGIARGGAGLRNDGVALRDVKLRMGGRSRRLLDEVDVINAVSGGSIVAAYYAVHREGLFRDFEAKFLKRDVERQLRAELLANLPRLAQPQFSRGEVLADYFDRELFRRRDVRRSGPRQHAAVCGHQRHRSGDRCPVSFHAGPIRPAVLGPGSVSLGRAVAASAALPPFFSAITVENYAGTCGPVSLPGIAASIDRSARTRVVRLEEARTYMDRSRRPHVHLVDGGLIDNLGLRVAGDFAVEQGGFFELVDALGYRDVTHVVFISVNAETDPNYAIDQSADTPNFFQTLNALKLPGRAHSFDVAEQLRSSFEVWRDEVRSGVLARARRCGRVGPQFYFIDVSLQAIEDEEERNGFQGIPTALTLDPAAVDRLRAVARKLLLGSADFKRLVADLGS